MGAKGKKDWIKANWRKAMVNVSDRFFVEFKESCTFRVAGHLEFAIEG